MRWLKYVNLLRPKRGGHRRPRKAASPQAKGKESMPLPGQSLEAERRRRMALAYRWADGNRTRYATYEQFRADHNSEGVNKW